LGELYAEIKYGIKRHKPHTRGSDGKLGNDFVEIKTISPEKDGGQVQVKRAGNFNKLLVIKISEGFEFDGRFIERKQLSKAKEPMRGCLGRPSPLPSKSPNLEPYA
jgi:hypothetical protein